MCFQAPKMPDIPDPVMPPDPGAMEAQRARNREDALRRRRAGAAADVLTSPTGIGGRSAKLGGDA